MPATEPTPQEKSLRRVLFVSALDGWGLVVFATFGILLTLAFGDYSGLFVGALVLAAGAMELRGRRKLLRRDAGGMKLLVRAQLLLLCVILVYCASRLGSFDGDTVMANFTPEMEAMLKENGVSRAEVLPLVQIAFYASYGLLAFLTLLFQGGLTLYYRSRIARVTEALAAPPPA